MQLVGRRVECSMLEQLLSATHGGHGGSLVLRGDPGVGKTALLEFAVDSALGFRVARTGGVEAEVELPFAALHQLCSPVLELATDLPAPQQAALEIAFGLRIGPAPGRFLVGLAVLSLLSATAERQPLVCVVDDAQWLDSESAHTLGFVARRLLADRVALLFATRDPLRELAGLPELEVDGLCDDDARALLSPTVDASLDPRVVDRIVAEAAGNPLALLELPKARTWAELAAGVTPMATGPVTRRIEEVFQRRAADLPPDSRRLLVLVSADQLGDARKIWRAAERLDIPRDAAEPTEEAGLLAVGTDLCFRHPLVRSAIYRAASPLDRRDAHRALAEVTNRETDPDRRAWHMAAAAIGPDVAVADELERSAGRAKERGGVAAAAAFLERSAHFTPDPACQALRCLRAADAYLEAGAHEEARNLLKSASRRLDDPVARAQAMRLDAAIRFAEGLGGETPTLFLHAARALREVDPASAVDTLTEALEAATWAGDLGSGTTARDVAVATAQLPDGDHERTATLLLKGYAARSNDYREAVRLWGSAVRAGARDATGATRLQHLSVLFLVTGDMLDFEHHAAVADERVRVARAEGALIHLPGALSSQAWCARLAGHLDRAHALDVESTDIADAIGTPPTPGAHDIVRLGLVAWRGEDAEARKLAEAVASEAVERGQGMTVAMVESFLMTLDLGTGRYEEALGHGRTLLDADPLYVCSLSLGDVVEAAVRADDRRTAAAALTRLQERAGASGTPWGLGLLARARALLADASRAESLYLESLEHLRRAGVATDWARSSLVFGEWLRRQRRRRDARVQLRSAERFFEATGAEAFLQRAAAEQRATGEQGRSPGFSERIPLTPQEQRVAELAAEGLSNAEIGAQLFVSPHTVSYHLRKVFTKLGVRSRKQLAHELRSRLKVSG